MVHNVFATGYFRGGNSAWRAEVTGHRGCRAECLNEGSQNTDTQLCVHLVNCLRAVTLGAQALLSHCSPGFPVYNYIIIVTYIQQAHTYFS